MVVARGWFCKMPQRNDVSWVVMIAGYVGQELYNDAIKCFHWMLSDGNAQPNEAVLVSVLSACAHLGALDQGKWVHIYIERSERVQSSNISIALIDMYAKCGQIDCTKHVFNGTGKRDLLTWTSMISGFSMHGLGREALEFHSGRVEEGLSIFYEMEHSWGIAPKPEHYGCLIDLLSRSGQLKSAFESVRIMYCSRIRSGILKEYVLFKNKAFLIFRHAITS
ncbi:hypothetical protein RJ640_001533 [Escallonia rubra]|uniref:Pentatricopeptide repeat-containing protein n=1 Tax=Escallonia rubra TaxID=112253 RepID=A0AA88UP62_9ASTE|nr:hypothetical protein RJ640_001533 [Escallonia rubra]